MNDFNSTTVQEQAANDETAQTASSAQAEPQKTGTLPDSPGAAAQATRPEPGEASLRHIRSARSLRHR